MIKFLKNHIDGKLIKSLFKLALIYCLLFNSAIFIYKFNYHKADVVSAIFELSKDFIYNIVTLFIFFSALTINRFLFYIASVFLFITGAIASYYLFFFSIAPTPGMMPILFGTNMEEASELISYRIIIWVIFSIIICLFVIKMLNIRPSKLIFTKLLSIICLVVICANIVYPRFSFLRSYFPFQYLHNSYKFLFADIEDYKKEDISIKYNFVDSKDDDLIVVLVIGESARYSNFHINGYKRETTPYLSNRDDVASFKSRSCASSTFLSVPCMISRVGEKDIDKMDKETSILSIFTRLGYDTVWLGTQSITKYYRSKPGGSFYDEANFNLIPGGSLVFLPNTDDMRMIPYLKENTSEDAKKFIVLHTTGSHWNYGARYPKGFGKFKPDLYATDKRHDASTCDRCELINSYDNSILYTDFFLNSVMEELKDKKAFVIYSSDHGESLGESNRLGHGFEDYWEEQRTVPFMVWMSDSYKKSYPEKWDAIKSIQEKEISHDYIFHSILDCAGIKSDIIDKSLSLCDVKKINNY